MNCRFIARAFAFALAGLCASAAHAVGPTLGALVLQDANGVSQSECITTTGGVFYVCQLNFGVNPSTGLPAPLVVDPGTGALTVLDSQAHSDLQALLAQLPPAAQAHTDAGATSTAISAAVAGAGAQAHTDAVASATAIGSAAGQAHTDAGLNASAANQVSEAAAAHTDATATSTAVGSAAAQAHSDAVLSASAVGQATQITAEQASAAALGAQADAAYAGSGNGGVIGLLKGIWTKLAGTLAVSNAQEHTDLGAILNPMQTLAGAVASGQVSVNCVTGCANSGSGGGGAVTVADGANITLGSKADTPWSGTGSGSLISIGKAAEVNAASAATLAHTDAQAVAAAAGGALTSAQLSTAALSTAALQTSIGTTAHSDAQSIVSAISAQAAPVGVATAALQSSVGATAHTDAAAIATALGAGIGVTGPLTGAQLTAAALATSSLQSSTAATAHTDALNLLTQMQAPANPSTAPTLANQSSQLTAEQASAATLGTQADAAYTGSGNGGVVGLLKWIGAKLAGTLAVSNSVEHTDLGSVVAALAPRTVSSTSGAVVTIAAAGTVQTDLAASPRNSCLVVNKSTTPLTVYFAAAATVTAAASGSSPIPGVVLAGSPGGGLDGGTVPCQLGAVTYQGEVSVMSGATGATVGNIVS